jgi:DNA-binding CsgD family transcriptional regulator
MEPLIKEAQEAIQLGLANADDMRRFFELAMNFYQTKGLHEPALAFAQKTLAIKDSLRILEQNEKAIELQTKYKTEILEKENLLNAAKAESLSSKLKLRSRSVYLLSALLVFVTLATMFVIRSLKLKQEVNQTKLQHALKTKERVEQQNKVLAENLILKEKLVQNQRMQLEQNAVEVMSLTAQLEVSQDPGSTNELATSTTSNSNDANYWKNFMEQFRRVNPDFMESLEKACPGLSRSEKEFCVLIKLGMSYKEIANVLRISHSSAITKKYRICKKLSVASDTDFYIFIKSLD